MSGLALSQALPAATPINTTPYTHKQEQLCYNNSRTVSVYSIHEPDYTPASRVSQIFSATINVAISGIGQIFSAVDRGFSWIDSFSPKVTFAQGQVVTAQDEPQKPSKASEALTPDEQVFLGDLEVCVRLAQIAPKDNRYLRAIYEMIETYMENNQIQAFPPHMSRATELLADQLTKWQFIVIRDGLPQFDKPGPLSENCFYHQVHAAVESAQMTTTVKERIMATRVVQRIVEEYLNSNNFALFPAQVLAKFGQITDKLCGFFEKELLSKKLPYFKE